MKKLLVLIQTCVGVMWLISSDANDFKIVVFPALSNPKSNIRNSLSFPDFIFRNKSKRPWNRIETSF